MVDDIFKNPFNESTNRLKKLQEEIANSASSKPTGRFAQLDSYLNSLTPHQQKFIGEQPQVQQLQQQLLTIFLSQFMFGNLKHQFETWCKANGLELLVNEYVDTCLSMTKNYKDPTQEIKELKEKLALLEQSKVKQDIL